MRRSLTAAALCALFVSAPLAAQTAAPAGWTPTTFQWNATTKTFTYLLLGGMEGGKGPFNYNRAMDGELTITVPVGATAVITFVNEDGVPHSAEVIADKDPMPTEGGHPAIPRAYTIKSVEGMAQGAKDVMRFKGTEAGTFRIFCGVPGHGLSGMWVRFNVSASATEPSVALTPRPVKAKASE